MAAGKKGPASRGAPRQSHVRVKSAKGRKLSSKLWLERQLNDPYVVEAKKLGYRSRAAFKLVEIDDKYKFLKSGGRIVDLGAAPGGWVQIALKRVGAKGRVVGIDLQEIDPIIGSELLVGDFLDEDAPDRLRALMDGPADVVLSDMAASSTGHAPTDHLRIMGLAEAALDFAIEVLAPGGTFVAKVLQGGSERGLLDTMRRNFTKVAHVKPPSSRKDSAELYVVATGFRGRKEDEETTETE